MNEAVRVLLIGTGFMGDVHSQAWRTVAPVFGTARVELAGVVARDPVRLEEFARRWGWQRWYTDLEKALEDEIDLVDVTSPNYEHRRHVESALDANCHVVCEKPMAASYDDAQAMALTARARQTRSYVWYNYRRVPAITLARNLVMEGRIGRIHQVRAAYLQSWGKTAPHSWRFDSSLAGSGAHGDINAHIVDTARYVTGEEIVEILGSAQETFVAERERDGIKKPSSVDDVSIFVGRLTSGGLATFEASRMATGYMSANRIEIHGERGALRFDFEHMNALEFFDAKDPGREQGWRRIHVTRGQYGHPYVDHWWPEGHGIGYEHTFIHQAADMLTDLTEGKICAPLPDFEDALRTEAVLHTATASAHGRGARLVIPPTPAHPNNQEET